MMMLNDEFADLSISETVHPAPRVHATSNPASFRRCDNSWRKLPQSLCMMLRPRMFTDSGRLVPPVGDRNPRIFDMHLSKPP